LQRLFSNFANGWPGAGLLLQRMLMTAMLIRHGVSDLAASSATWPTTIGVVILVAALLLLLGLCTPIVGTVVAVFDVWLAVNHAGDSWAPLVEATLGATIAMIGPGAWSVDARLFGRKHIEA